ncbi:MAG TPA: hypothetical protein PKM30_06695 [Saprospiraceae bacterium]|jgi:hypothetical protein|nr:MAG: hypothetical protein QY315_09860 [Saprospiraceae bacterium]HMY84355.1 hypothetical protein [Saprospiraceae bacterium]HMZ24600.1 hypothetical protein [Saprospiraceae bacterium]HNA76382.1 hypothetical protein [Saprospiraceae bacterium]HNB61513.1 hypothetical protein [Saprospiraceae bacterium]
MTERESMEFGGYCKNKDHLLWNQQQGEMKVRNGQTISTAS